MVLRLLRACTYTRAATPALRCGKMAAYGLRPTFLRASFPLSFLAIAVLCQEQVSPGSRYYGRDGVYVPPNDRDHRTDTYVYKDRRYGYRPSYLDPVYKPAKLPEDRYLEVSRSKSLSPALLPLPCSSNLCQKSVTPPSQRSWIILRKTHPFCPLFKSHRHPLTVNA